MGVVIEFRRPAPGPVNPYAAAQHAYVDLIGVEACRQDKIADLRSAATFRAIAANTWTLAGCRNCGRCSDLAGRPLI